MHGPLSVAEAVLGTKVNVPTVDGSVLLTIPPGTSSGAKLRLRGKGIKPAKGDAGDLYAIVKIVTPKAEGLTGDGYRIIFNTGPHSGQEVDHAHAHVLGGAPLGPMLCQ